MKKQIAFLVLVLACVAGRATAQCPRIETYFSSVSTPDSIEHTIIRLIDSAHSQILVQAFDLTAGDIAKALLRAKRRSVSPGHRIEVRILLDKRNETNTSPLTKLQKTIATQVDTVHGFAHNKIIVIDASIVVTGSYNFTNHAKKNAENLIVIHDSTTARQYLDNWYARRSYSRKAKKHSPIGK